MIVTHSRFAPTGQGRFFLFHLLPTSSPYGAFITSPHLTSPNHQIIHHQITTLSLHYHITTLSHSHIVTFPHYHIATLSHYHIPALSHYHIVTLSHYRIITLPHYHIPTLSHSHIVTFHIITFPHYHIITLSHYHIITFPHYHYITTSLDHYKGMLGLTSTLLGNALGCISRRSMTICPMSSGCIFHASFSPGLPSLK